MGRSRQFVELKLIHTRHDGKHEYNILFRPDAASWSRGEGDTSNFTRRGRTCLFRSIIIIILNVSGNHELITISYKQKLSERRIGLLEGAELKQLKSFNVETLTVEVKNSNVPVVAWLPPCNVHSAIRSRHFNKSQLYYYWLVTASPVLHKLFLSACVVTCWVRCVW